MKFLPTTLVLLICIAWQTGQAQTKQQKDSLNTARVAGLINTQDFLFKAQNAIPLGGKTRYLTGDDYDLMVSKDTVVAYLPYFGRAYSAPVNPSQSGIKFTSTKFDYKITPRKKDGWDITIKPNDVPDVAQLFLTVSSSGYTTLQVSSINRQAISFNGEIVKRKRRHKG